MRKCFLILQIFGFEEIEAPNFGEFKVIWLILLLAVNQRNLPGY